MKTYLAVLILGMFALTGTVNAGVVATKIVQDAEHGESRQQIKQNAENKIAEEKSHIEEQVENKIGQKDLSLISIDETDKPVN